MIRIQFHSVKIVAVLLLVAIAASGCVIIPEKSPPTLLGDAVRANNFAEAQKSIAGIYDDKKNRALMLMEVGLVDYLSKDHQQSIHKLNQAEVLTDEAETKRASEYLKSIMAGPTSLSYGGALFERAFIHYYKAMNFLLLANNRTGNAREDALEGARVEARKIDRLLNSIQDQEPTYDEAKEGKESIFKQMTLLLRGLYGRTLDRDALAYREDAYIRYMEGVIYESNGELDSARIAYQTAATLYEKGYAKQYGLGQAIVEMAWFEVIRVMKKAGGYRNEVAELTKSKLSKEMKQRLDTFDQGSAQLVVINHIGFAPKPKEMMLRLQLDTHTKELILTPAILNPHLLSAANDVGPVELKEQLTWFNEMYSDRGLVDILSNYKKRGAFGVARGLTEKRISIDSLWSLAEDTGLVSGLDWGGAIVQVPYLGSIATNFDSSQVTLDGQVKGSMVAAESIATIALQQQLLGAGRGLRAALARELTKISFCSQVAKSAGGGFKSEIAEKVCILGFSMVSGADTRSWSTLPHTIMIQRYPVEAGQHTVTVTTSRTGGGIFHQAEYEIEIKKGQLMVLNNRAVSTTQVATTPLIATKYEPKTE
ncbi:MAG: hypothetical protein L3J62_09255 [Gammaproteobacteria bacterium]|nr:hypothetical protein [Gammaproteobacteria bacterium]MCF6230956.1 hypothetical protein [Gammaproteobacteria bacterium]